MSKKGVDHNEILEAIISSKSMADVGRQFGISRERVRQISNENGFNHKKYRKYKINLFECNHCHKHYISFIRKSSFCTIPCWGKFIRECDTRDKSRRYYPPSRIESGVKSYRSTYLGMKNGKQQYKYTHRLVMEKHLGRKLKTSEHVHHLDGDGRNNELSNLKIMSHSDHASQIAKKTFGKDTEHMKDIKPIILESLSLTKEEIQNWGL